MRDDHDDGVRKTTLFLITCQRVDKARRSTYKEKRVGDCSVSISIRAVISVFERRPDFDPKLVSRKDSSSRYR